MTLAVALLLNAAAAFFGAASAVMRGSVRLIMGLAALAFVTAAILVALLGLPP
jgi:hypothetical protein